MNRILIADDHDLVRDTLAVYLENVADFTVVTAPDLPGAVALMEDAGQIDLAILDYSMPGMNGLGGLDHARKQFPDTKVVLMSGVANRDVATAAMGRGADGFIPKSLPPDALVGAIRLVLSGERFFPFDFSYVPPADTASGAFSDLSEREMQTLEQLCIGLTNKEIARNLGIQEVTVKLHVKNLLAKLGVGNRTQAALLAKENHVF